MIVLGAVSQAEAERAFRECLALGLRPSACELQAGMVDGRVCDGTIVVEVGSRRCVTAAELERKAAAIAASPLPARTSSSSASWLAAGGAVVVVAALAVLVWRVRT